MVKDSSPDAGWQKITAISIQDRQMRGVKLSRNFVPQSAVTAGLNIARSKRHVVIDCYL